MSGSSLINPADTIERQNEKLIAISEVLMRRVEQVTDEDGAAYEHFQRAVMLADEVRDRTRDLEHALDLLNQSNAQLAEATQTAEAARALLASAIETIQEGFGLFDEAGSLVLSNSRFCQYMPDIVEQITPGLEFEDYIGLISRSQYLALPDGESRASWREMRLRKHRDPHVVFKVAIEGDRWIQVSEHRTSGGQTVILQTEVSEIMRLERLERSRILDDQARVLAATLEHLTQGICIFDTSAQLVGWNSKASDMLSIPVRTMRLGTPFEDLFAATRDTLIFGSGIARDDVMRWVTCDVERRPISFEIQRGKSAVLHVTAREMPDGGFVISLSDVTAERESARALTAAKEMLEQRVLERTLDLEDALSHAERANASKTRFVAAASHDLLQPLSAAKLYLASVADDIAGQPLSHLNKAQSALESVEDIIDALLDISRLESGLAAMQASTVDLDEILFQLRDEFLPVANLKNLRLAIRPTGAHIRTDARYIRRILQNLIGNAVRYTEAGGVLVGARQRGPVMRLEVWDTGPGIPEDAQEDIFKEFHRLDARASASAGMGLGLAIVERACAALGHPLTLRSSVGGGSVFAVSVPRADAARAVRPSGQDAGTGETDLSGLVVGVIEADKDVEIAITHLLEQWGADVISARDREAMASLLEEIDLLPDVLIGDGSDADTVRDLARVFPGMRMVATTATRCGDLKSVCAGLAIPLVHKPLNADALSRALRETARS